MKLVNLNGPQDVMALLVRRKWWILLPFIALSAGVVLITAILPQMYVSQSLIVIRPRDVHDDFVKDLTAGSQVERLSVITERVLSDTNLKNVLDRFGDDLPEFHHLNLQERIVKLRNQVDLEFSGGERLKKAGQVPVSSFRISSQNRNPIMAQKIVRQLTDVFIGEDRKNREANVNETAQFLQNQVDDLAARLAASDTKLKELRSRRRDELPNQLESNLRRLENLGNDNQALRRDRTNYVLAQGQFEQQLSETPKRIPKPIPAAPQGKSEDPEVKEYREILAEVKAVSRRGYTEKSPDVQRLRLQLQRLEENMTPEQLALAKEPNIPPTRAASPETETETDTDATQINPVYVRTESTLEILKKQIEHIDERIAQNEEKIKVYNQHVNNVPQGEQELADVMRENNDLSRQYLEMSSKLAAARLSESAENQQKGAQFEIVDPATLPLKPTKPAKSMIMGAGVGVSLLFALAIAFLVDTATQKPWTHSDITHLLGIKVLVEVPRIATRDGVAEARKKKIAFLASVGAAAVLYAVCLYLAYDHSGFVLQRLDPFIQKLY